MRDIFVLVDTTRNFTPASLMHRYSKQTPGAVFDRGPYGEALLILAGVTYKYRHWHISDGYVILTLEEVQQ